MNWAFEVEELAEAHKKKQSLSIKRNMAKINLNKCSQLSKESTKNKVLS